MKILDKDGKEQSLVSSGIEGLATLLSNIWSTIRAPEYMQVGPSGKAIRAILNTDSTSNVATVTTVTTVTNLTNLNGIDSRELVWGAWNQNFANIRNKVI